MNTPRPNACARPRRRGKVVVIIRDTPAGLLRAFALVDRMAAEGKRPHPRDDARFKICNPGGRRAP